MITDLFEFLTKSFEKGATDVHIKHNRHARVRFGGELKETREFDIASCNVTQIAKRLLSDKEKETLRTERCAQGVVDINDKVKLRYTFSFDSTKLYFCARLLPAKQRSWENLGIPKLAVNFIHKGQGMILISGPICSGKTSTMTSFVAYMNQIRKDHIIVMDELLEYKLKSANSIINLRQIGKDTHDYVSGLKYALREDPDTLFVGEIKDYRSAEIALSIAETGHMIVAGIATIGCLNSISRILNSFPSHQTEMARLKLSSYLIGCISQVLVPDAQNIQSVPLFEVMGMTPSIANSIRLDKSMQLKAEMSRSIKGVSITFEDYAKELKAKGTISPTLDISYLSN